MFTTPDELAHFEHAIRTATDPGYVLVGPADKLYRRDPDTGPHAAVPVHGAEADTVTAMLERRYLRTSSRTRVEIDGETSNAYELHLRPRTRDRVQRWQRDRARHTTSGRPCRFCDGQGSHPGMAAATWTPERGMHRPPAPRTLCPHCQTPTPREHR